MSLRQLFGKPVADTWIVHAASALAWCAWLWLSASACESRRRRGFRARHSPGRAPGSRAMKVLAACSGWHHLGGHVAN